MRRPVVLMSFVACALAFGLAAHAQDTTKKPAASGAKEHTMTGCLQKGSEAGSFVVENTAGKGPKTIVVLESKDKLDPHVGHKIDITGTDVPAKEVESMKMKHAKGDHYMKVTAMKMVSPTCP